MVRPHEGGSFFLAGGLGEGCNWGLQPSWRSGSWSVTASYKGGLVLPVFASRSSASCDSCLF